MLKTHPRFVLAALAILGGAVLTASASVPLTSLANDQAAVVLSIHDVPTLIRNWDKSPWAKTWNDEQVIRFFAPLRAQMKVEEWDEISKTETGYTVREIAGFATGDAIVIIPNFDWAVQGDQPGTPPVLIAVEVGDNAAKIEGLLQKAHQKAGTTEETEDFAGVTVHIEKDKPAADAKAAERPPAVWAFDDGIWLLSPTKESVIGAIDAIKRGGLANPLGQSERYLKMKQRVGESQVVFYVNVQAIYPAIKQLVEKKAAAKPANPMGPDPRAALTAVGLDAINEFYGAIHFGDEATETTGAITTSDNRGLLKLIAFHEGPIPQPKFISTNWVSVSVSKYSIRDAYTGLEEMLENISPAMSGMVQGQLRAYNKQLGVDLKRDLIGSLGDTLVSAQALEPPSGAPAAKRGLLPLIAVSVDNVDAFTSALEAVKRMSGPEPDKVFVKRAYLGQTIYTFSPPQPQGAPAPKGFSYAIAGGYFFLSIGSSAPLETALQGLAGGQPSFWDKPEVKHALQEAPSNSSAFQYQDIRAILATVFENMVTVGAMAGKSSDSAPVPVQGDGNNETAPEMKTPKTFFDASAKPDAEVIGKYWSYGYSTGYRDTTGVYFQSKIIYPK